VPRAHFNQYKDKNSIPISAQIRI